MLEDLHREKEIRGGMGPRPWEAIKDRPLGIAHGSRKEMRTRILDVF